MKMRPMSTPQSSQPPATSSTPQPDETVSFLQWGSSVNLCEDLRRSITAEVDDIDTSITDLQGKIKNEERTSVHLAKNLSHDRAEMEGLRRGAADELDAALMQDQVRDRLTTSLKSELLSPMSDMTADPATPMAVNDSCMDDTTTPATAMTKPPTSIRAHLQQRAAKLKEASTTLTAEKETVKGMAAELEQVVGESEAVISEIETNKLVEELEAAKKETALREQERDNQDRRKADTKEQLQQFRAQSAQHAQEIADMLKEQAAQKAEQEQKEAEMARRLKEAEEELRVLNQDTSLETELATLTKQVEEVNKQLEMVGNICKDREKLASASTALKTEIKDLTKVKEECQDKVKSAESKCNESDGLLRDAKVKLEAAEAQRIDNDKVHAEQIVPGQAEKDELSKVKEECVCSMNELHQAAVIQEQEHNGVLTEKTDILNKLNDEFQDLSKTVAEKLLVKESMEQEQENEMDAYEKELEEHHNFRDKFTEAAAAENERLEELTAEREQKRLALEKEAGEERERSRAEVKRKLAILEAGAVLLEDAKRYEEKAATKINAEKKRMSEATE